MVEGEDPRLYADIPQEQAEAAARLADEADEQEQLREAIELMRQTGEGAGREGDVYDELQGLTLTIPKPEEYIARSDIAMLDEMEEMLKAAHGRVDETTGLPSPVATDIPPIGEWLDTPMYDPGGSMGKTTWKDVLERAYQEGEAAVMNNPNLGGWLPFTLDGTEWNTVWKYDLY